MLGKTNTIAGRANGLQIGQSVSSPRENDLRIPSASNINDYCFGFIPPTSPQTGDIWFELKNKKGVTSIDLLDNNNIQVPVFITKQWNGSAWVKKPLQIYKDGAWQNARWYIMKDGSWKADSGYLLPDTGTYSGYTSGDFFEFPHSRMRLAACDLDDDTGTAVAGTGARRRLFKDQAKSIDWTDISSLNFKFTAYCDNFDNLHANSQIGAYVSNAHGSSQIYNTSNVVAQTVKTKANITLTNQVFTVDTSSISGYYYYGIDIAKSGNGTKKSTFYIDITDIWVE